jgi:hypothetical protein
MLRRRMTTCKKADGYVNNSTESIQVETTTPETTAISDATENNNNETAVLAEQYVTTTDAVTENVNQSIKLNRGFQCRGR